MDRIDAFLVEVLEVSARHGLCLGHEDGQGPFQVWRYSPHFANWLLDATDETTKQTPEEYQSEKERQDDET